MTNCEFCAQGLAVGVGAHTLLHRMTEPDDGCHCGHPVAAVTDPETRDLGPAPYALCERCLPLRCDVSPGACDR